MNMISLKTAFLAVFITVMLTWLLSPLVYSQTSTQPPQSDNRVRDPAKIKYNFRMEVSSKQMEWSRIYFESFKKTDEVSYLRLAAQFCLNAISSYHQTQNLLSKTTRFHYQTKKRKITACQFYTTLQLASHHLAVEHHLRPADQNVCTF